jgi:hypothetical protein
MENIYEYATVVEALEILKKLGFETDFNILSNQIIKNPSHFKIHHIYRYEGDSNPDDEATVYGLESLNGEKGVYVAGYSANSENDAAEVLQKINIQK